MKAKTKRKIHHLVTKKKLVKKKTSRQVLRSFFIIVMAGCTSSLVFAVAVTKPTINTQIRTQLKTKSITFEPVVAAPPSEQAGTASWYALGLPAPDALSCASRTFPRGTYLQVTNLHNGQSVTCLVNDYGPEAYTGRIIDLSRGSFRSVADLGSGTIPVKLHAVSGPQLNLNAPNLLSQLSGYALCSTSFTASFCDSNRQKPLTLH